MPETTTTETLLAEFPKATPADWKQLVEAELKGAPFDRKMLHTTVEGIPLKPLYGPADSAVGLKTGWPGFPPYIRGTRAGGYQEHPWEVSQEIQEGSPTAFNDAARAGLHRGLVAVNMVLDRATRNGADPDWARPEDVGAGGLSLATLSDLGRALDGVDLAQVPLFIRSGASGMPVGALLVALARRRGLDPAQLRGCIEIDPLGVLAHEGQLPQSLSAAYREMGALTAWAVDRAPGLQTICVHSRPWHEAGAHAVQELAYTLATAMEYFRALHGQGMEAGVVAPRIRLALTVGSQFFVEVAKLRAMRGLWSRLVDVLGGDALAQRSTIHVRTNRFNKTVYDPYVNLLRTSVEAFAGVLGGGDSMQVGAFDEWVRPPSEFAQRLARNQQLVLRDECHLTQVVDPAGGSWLVEHLTAELASRAWTLFQEIEKQGGMAAAMRSGGPQREVAQVATGRVQRVNQRRESVIGVNQYVQVQEKPLEVPVTDPEAFHRRRVQQVTAARTASDDAAHRKVLERLTSVVGQTGPGCFEACVAAVQAGATLGEITRAVRIQDQPDAPLTPVCITRAAWPLEALRARVDAHARRTGGRPSVFLAGMGPLKQHKARADFAQGFLAIAGIAAELKGGWASPEEAAAAALAAGATAICICSTDDTYPALVGPLVAAWRAGCPQGLVLLAGYPPDQVDAHRQAGVDAFVHLRADALEVLTMVVGKMGVTA
jgi:methylmalonyl-CoA mutase